MKIISEQPLRSLFHWKNEDKSLGNVKYIICYIFGKMQEIRASEANIEFSANFSQTSAIPHTQTLV